LFEIPVAFWERIANVIKAQLKKAAFLIVDSQQNCDPSFHQFALDQFAHDFYGPYFDEYPKISLENFSEEQGFSLIYKEHVLFSKSLLFSN